MDNNTLDKEHMDLSEIGDPHFDPQFKGFTVASRQEQAWDFINSTFLKLIMSDKKVSYEVKKSIEAFWIDLFATDVVQENMIQAVNNFLWEIDRKMDAARKAGMMQVRDAFEVSFPADASHPENLAISKSVLGMIDSLLLAEDTAEETINDIENTDLSEVGGGDEDDSPIV